MIIFYIMLTNAIIAAFVFMIIFLAVFIQKKYPNSKLSDFCRNNIISDKYDE